MGRGSGCLFRGRIVRVLCGAPGGCGKDEECSGKVAHVSLVSVDSRSAQFFEFRFRSRLLRGE
jgi:hypothetical protein